jgi:hypothetical protein
VEVAPTSPTTAPSPCPNTIYEQPILTAVHRIDLPVTAPDLHLVPAPHLVSTTHEDEVTTDVLQEPRPDRLQKEGPGAKSLSGTALPQDLVERI